MIERMICLSRIFYSFFAIHLIITSLNLHFLICYEDAFVEKTNLKSLNEDLGWLGHVILPCLDGVYSKKKQTLSEES